MLLCLVFFGEVFIEPWGLLPLGFGFGAGDGDEDVGEHVCGDFDFDAGVFFPEAFDFVKLKDAICSDYHEVWCVEAVCGEAEFVTLKGVGGDFASEFALFQHGGVGGLVLVHFASLVGGACEADGTVHGIYNLQFTIYD